MKRISYSPPLRSLKKPVREIKLIIAPRHPNRFDEVERIIKEAGLKINRT